MNYRQNGGKRDIDVKVAINYPDHKKVINCALKQEQLFLITSLCISIPDYQQVIIKTTVTTGADVFLGVLAVHFFVFTENIIHSFLGRRNDVWASVHTEFSE